MDGTGSRSWPMSSATGGVEMSAAATTCNCQSDCRCLAFLNKSIVHLAHLVGLGIQVHAYC